MIKRPVFLFDIMRNFQKLVLIKPRFSKRVSVAKNEGNVKHIRYNKGFVKSHVGYNKGPPYMSFRYWQYWHLRKEFDLVSFLEKYQSQIWSWAKQCPLFLGVGSLHENTKFCKLEIHSVFGIAILAMKFDNGLILWYNIWYDIGIIYGTIFVTLRRQI